MKRIWVSVLFLLLLIGCESREDGIDDALSLRQQILSASGCSFTCNVVADYNEFTHSFQLCCETDLNGDLAFTVTEPETIAGIRGKIDKKGGKIIFEDQFLAFPLLADDLLSPVAVPWIFIQAITGGYIHSAGEEKGCTRITIDDTYEGSPLQIDIRIDSNNIPINGQIVWQGKRILSFTVTEFICL